MINRLKRIIIIFGIILVILIIGYIFYNIANKEILIAENNLNYINDVDEWDYSIRYPDNAHNLKNTYKGNLSIKNIGKSMYYFTNEIIPKYYSEFKNATENEILEYYNNHSKVIAIDIGIDNEEDFQNLVEDIQKLNLEKVTLNSFTLDKDNTKVKSNYTETVLYITYEGNEEIGFNVKIYNEIQDNASTLVYTSKQ